ncbi:HalOD1 output domain-containing protein [Halobaculum halobium]|uniref:HalOD1 output domain-containing protein n=1 Tax=Halobaculum halobium TaxID=3032281 RepID=A0ABD5T6H2_9EURY|nr:HalOD1 output domain-containing protein [Halobaculum sp. SYNS20]
MEYEAGTVVRTTEEQSVSETVIFAVADARGVAPTELEPPLYDAVDADALERLCESAEAGAHPTAIEVEFTWAGCEVFVGSNGRVVVTRTGAGSITERGEPQLVVE